MCVSMTTIQVIFNDKITAVKILQKSGNNAKDDHVRNRSRPTWFGLNILGQPLANSKIELINHGGGGIISR